MVFRFLSCNQTPEHTTLSRFRKRHSAAFTALFTQVLEYAGSRVSGGRERPRWMERS